MIVLAKVTKLVHDDVIGKLTREKEKRVRKIQIPFPRTAPPQSLRILDRYPPVRKAVESIPILHALHHERAHLLAVL